MQQKAAGTMPHATQVLNLATARWTTAVQGLAVASHVNAVKILRAEMEHAEADIRAAVALLYAEQTGS